MLAINIHEAKTKLSALIAAVEEKGDTITICRSGKPVAQLAPVQKARDPMKQSARLRHVVFKADPSLPLTPDEWPETLR